MSPVKSVIDVLNVEHDSQNKTEAAEQLKGTTTSDCMTAEEKLRLIEINLFLSANEISVNKKRLKQLLALPSGSFEAYKLGVSVANCCRDMNLTKAVSIYRESKLNGVVPGIETYSNLISLVAGLGDQGSSSGPPRETEPPTDIDAAVSIYSDIKAAGFPMTESIYTAMIRCNSINNRSSEALSIYYEMCSSRNTENSTVLIPKLRTFSPLLGVFSTQGNCDVCLSLYDDMVSKYNLQPTEREYLYLLKVTLLAKDKALFLIILNQMKEDIMVPSVEGAWPIFREWFTSMGYQVLESQVSVDGVVDAVPDSKLQSIEMDESTQAKFLSQIESYALNRAHTRSSSHAADDAGTKCEEKITNPIKKDNRHEAKWDNFKLWLQSLAKISSGPSDVTRFPISIANFPVINASDRSYDIVVDGANVGYYKQNYLGAPEHIDYAQLNGLLRQLKHRGYRPLLILHSRHLQASMVGSYGPLVDSWREENMLFQTPSGWNDDWFWLYTAVTLGCHVVTNDEMRDHHFQMLSPRWFSRWKERHQVHFSFGRWLKRGVADITADESNAWGLYSHRLDAHSFESEGNTSEIEATSSSSSRLHSSYSNRIKNSNQQIAVDSKVSATSSGGKSEGSSGMRLALFEMPSVYSHRVQILTRCEQSEAAAIDPGEFPAAQGIINEYFFPGKNNSTWLCVVKRPTVPSDISTYSSYDNRSSDTSDTSESMPSSYGGSLKRSLNGADGVTGDGNTLESQNNLAGVEEGGLIIAARCDVAGKRLRAI